MRRTGLALILTGAALLAGSAATAADLTSFLSPGALSEPHASFAGDCDKCHLVFTGIPDAKCLRCHEPIATRIAEQSGWHGTHRDGVCIDCHPDHRGASFSGTTDQAKAAFDHAETGFVIAGSHSPLPCAQCHDGPLQTVGPGCADCHDDPHDSARGPNCAPCHTDVAWDEQRFQFEDHRTAMGGGHQGVTCDQCHVHGMHLESVVGCAECHTLAHGGTTSDCADCHQVSGFVPAKFDHGPCTCAFPGKHQTVGCLECHAEFDFADTPTLCGGCHEDDRRHEPLGECARCHNATSWSDSQFDHDRTKFPLRGRHLAVSCTQCHTEAGVFRGASTACAGCHAEDGEAAHGDFGSYGGCERCHTTEGFAPSAFDHATVGFPLTGRHAQAPCQTCHAEKVDGYPR